jgi:hypothetical protein
MDYRELTSIARSHGLTSQSQITYLDSIVWQFETNDIGLSPEDAVNLVGRIAGRYDNPTDALRIIDNRVGEFIGKYDSSRLPIRLRELDKKDDTRLREIEQLKQPGLASSSAKLKVEHLEGTLYAMIDRVSGSPTNVGSPNYIREEVSPWQENAIRVLEDSL